MHVNHATAQILLRLLKSDDERILSIESTGALSPEQILLAGIEQLGLNLSVFKDIIQQTS